VSEETITTGVRDRSSTVSIIFPSLTSLPFPPHFHNPATEGGWTPPKPIGRGEIEGRRPYYAYPVSPGSTFKLIWGTRVKQGKAAHG